MQKKVNVEMRKERQREKKKEHRVAINSTISALRRGSTVFHFAVPEITLKST